MQSISMTGRFALPLRSFAAFVLGAMLAIVPFAMSARADETAGQSAVTPEAALRIARAARAAGDYPSAINLYRGLAGTSAQVALELADTLLEAGSFDEAIQAYTQLQGNAQMRVPALLGLVRTELALGATDKALAYADEAKSLAPGDPRVLVARGVALDNAGRHAEAQASYRAVIAASPFDIAARNDLALSLALNKKFDEAIGIMAPIARSSNATAQARQNLALIYGLKGDHVQASEFNRADLDEKTAQANLRFYDFVRSKN